ncbi:DUF4416 family protein [bacterium]|nr:DUF4416 family protein [bacterium]
MIPQTIMPVKLFIGVLYSDVVQFEHALELVQSLYGQIDYRCKDFDFTATDYYVPEMGPSIYRNFISFKKLISAEDITAIKLETNEVELALAVGGSRRVNLDPGYMDFDKIVLASAKYNAQKILLNNGIWADLTLRYEKGQYHPYPWSFPDFKSGIYNAAFMSIRARYKAGIRALSK